MARRETYLTSEGLAKRETELERLRAGVRQEIARRIHEATELGGTVGGGYVRWNFFVDATVTVDGETWVEGGRLLR